MNRMDVIAGYLHIRSTVYAPQFSNSCRNCPKICASFSFNLALDAVDTTEFTNYFAGFVKGVRREYLWYSDKPTLWSTYGSVATLQEISLTRHKPTVTSAT
jgi:hypothetical protein